MWIISGLIIFFLNPEKNLQFIIYNLQLNIFLNVILFFFTLTLSLALTLALLFGNTRRGFLASLFLVSVLILKLHKVSCWWSILISFIFILFLELLIFFRHKKQNSNKARSPLA
ncbi:hypothetical protein COV89_02130 [Candidatus Shapirobacteria bacterium CG11_big_fil_rev_8_21_14_0_20_40_12]|uniref:Uncharacterized protein n=1 Tax=Candidatus Shapirobacteria bacterium CG11_big_fil_rev_8_21_14_0_20_40_12 TaxID=1974889 RepID=A0A2H0KFV4_9BACT|nr:MAG: hypothetical protein COV89_02130 [Candidatus Shapirobacteria bacterium CG11_big_fil_rev_8_21_14_0_20_40_12]